MIDTENEIGLLEPASQRVESVLRDRIETGVYTPKTWLPAERALADELGVHRRAVRSAITRLVEAGLIHQKARCRPVVAGREMVTASRQQSAVAPGLVALIMWHGGFEQGTTIQQRIFWTVNEALSSQGYHALFLDPGGSDDVGGEDENALREGPLLQYALDHGVAGVIFYPYAYSSNLSLMRRVRSTMPFVLIDRMVPGLETDFVGMQNREAMMSAVQHLLSLGHQRIACVCMPEPINSVQDRVAGYRAALQADGTAHGVIRHEMIINTDGTHHWDVFDAVVNMDPATRPTAIVCVNDYLAYNVCARLLLHGFRVPQDFSLVGFDDIIKVLPNGVSLTTISQPYEEIGREAAKLMLQRQTDHTSACIKRELRGQLVVRESAQAI
jgi:LacI family transcriptional regulator